MPPQDWPASIPRLPRVGVPVRAPMSVGPIESVEPVAEPLMSQGPPLLVAPAAAVPRVAPDLAGTTLGADLAPAPVAPVAIDPDLAALGVTSPRPAPLPVVPFLAPRPAPPAAAPPVEPQSREPVPFLRALATGRPVEDVTREMVPAQRTPSPRAMPRLVGGGPRRVREEEAPPVERDSLGRPLDPGFVDALTRHEGPLRREPQETAYDRERRAIDIARSLEQQRAEMIASQAADRADAEEAFARRQQEHEIARREAEGVARGNYDRAVSRLASMRVDPSRYWQRAGTAGTITNLIAVGLGAMGEALGGGPNRAIDLIQAEIDRDLRAQEQDIATAGQTADARRGVLSEVQRDYQSREAALEAARAIALREAAARAEADAATLGSAEAQANARVLRDRLLTQAEQAAAAAQQAEAESILNLREQVARIRRIEATASQAELRAQRMAGAGTGTPEPERVTSAQWLAYRDALANGATQQAAAALSGIPAAVVPQLSGSPVTTEQRSALDALDAALREVESGIESGTARGDIEGVGIVDRNLPAFLQSDEGLAMRTAIDNTVDLLGRLRSGAAITEDEWLRFSRVLEGSGTERELRIGISQIRSELASRLGLGGRRASGAQAADRAAAAAGVREVVE